MGHPIDEGRLTAHRIAEVEESPIVGRFDTFPRAPFPLCLIPSGETDNQEEFPRSLANLWDEVRSCPTG